MNPNDEIISSIDKLQKVLDRYMTKLNTTAFAKTGYTIDIIELLPFLERSGLRLVDYFKLLIIYK